MKIKKNENENVVNLIKKKINRNKIQEEKLYSKLTWHENVYEYYKLVEKIL